MPCAMEVPGSWLWSSSTKNGLNTCANGLKVSWFIVELSLARGGTGLEGEECLGILPGDVCRGILPLRVEFTDNRR